MNLDNEQKPSIEHKTNPKTDQQLKVNPAVLCRLVSYVENK
jgi:hypothetical protein